MAKVINIVQNELRHFLLLISFGLLGWVGSVYCGIGEEIKEAEVYRNALNALLSIGLYASVSGIDNRILSESKYIILSSVTIGVALKILIISAIYFLGFPSPMAFLYAVIVAQIDPLSVATMIGEKSSTISDKAGTIIRGWSSFDDPITIVFAIYIASTIAGNGIGEGILNIAINLGVSLSLFFIVYICRKKINKYNSIQFIILGLVFANAIFLDGLLLSALIALIIKPKIILKWMGKVIPYILYIAVILMGMQLTHGIQWSSAILLSISVVVSQVIVGWLLTRGLNMNDSLKICFAQQNGLTAMILALALSTQFPNLIAVIAPSIFIINLIHILSNVSIDIIMIRIENKKFR